MQPYGEAQLCDRAETIPGQLCPVTWGSGNEHTDAGYRPDTIPCPSPTRYRYAQTLFEQ